MRSIELALAWEFWRRSCIWILILLTALTGLQFMILQKLAEVEDSTQTLIQWLFIWLSIVIFIPII